MDRFLALYALALYRPRLIAGGFLVSLGVAMLVFAAGYVALSASAETGLEELNVTQDESGLTRADLSRGLAASTTDTPAPAPAEPATAAERNAPADNTTGVSVARATRPPSWVTDSWARAIPESVDEADASPYDEFGILRDVSHYTSDADGRALLRPLSHNFTAITYADLVKTHGKQPRPDRIYIPSINLSSPVVPLDIMWDGEASEWETADDAVGFHRGSATPGEIGNTVMSGHVNSPIAREGSIFARLDEIAPQLRRGEIVDIYVIVGDTVYLYRATDTRVVLPEELDVFDYSDEPTLSLVTCAPATTYSHRFIVNATLVGISRP